MASPIADAIVGRTLPPRKSYLFLRYLEDLKYAMLHTVCPILRPTIYYVDFTLGNDANAGTSPNAAWKNISQINTFLSAQARSFIAIALKCGEKWDVTVGINIPSNTSDFALCAYGTGVNPLINAYTSTLASGGTLFAPGTGGRYTTAISQPGDIRMTANRKKIFRKVASTLEVENTPDSWYWSGGTLHLHCTNEAGSAVDPDTFAWEYTLASTTDDCGIDVATGATRIRIDSIDCPGWGCDGAADPLNQNYGIRIAPTGTDIVLVTNCDARRSARHSMGRYSLGSGGLDMWLDNFTGGVTEAGGVPFVSYASAGSQETFVDGLDVDEGALPLTAARTYCEGYAALSHTNPGNTAGLVVFRNIRARKHPQNFGCHSIGSIENVPHFTDGNNASGVFINCLLEKADGTGSNGTYKSQGPAVGVLDIGSMYYYQPRNTAAGGLCMTGDRDWRGSWVDVSLQIDFNRAIYTDTLIGLINPDNITPKVAVALFDGCHFDIHCNSTTRFAISYWAAYADAGLNTTLVSYADGTIWKNGVWTVHRPARGSRTIPICRTGLRDTASSHQYSAFFNETPSGSLVGTANGTGIVNLSQPPAFGVPPQPSSLLVGAGEPGREYDSLLRQRSMTSTTIGAFECQPTSAFATTPAEYADAVRAELAAELARIDVATSSRNATTPPTVAAIRQEMDLNSTQLIQIAASASAANVAAVSAASQTTPAAQRAALGMAAADMDTQLSGLTGEIQAVQPGLTQPRVNFEAARPYQLDLVSMADGTYKAVGRTSRAVKLRPMDLGSVGITCQIFTGKVFGDRFVKTVGTPTLSGDANDLTVEAAGPRDASAMVTFKGTSTASDERECTFDMTMDGTNEPFPVTFDVEVFPN